MKIINPSFMKYVYPWALWNLGNHNHIYLTFDDGPHPRNTVRILNILKQFNAKATFFLTGNKVIQFPGIVEKIFQEQHVIGNHGFTHKPLVFKKKTFIKNEIDKTSQAIKHITGEHPEFFRPPHGWFDFRFKKIMTQKNMHLVLWSLLSYDFLEADSHNLYQRVIGNITSGDIAVFHDGHENASVMLQTLPDILTCLSDNNLNMSGIPV
ncbi:MAG: polysaccharide deacetylase family protein [bacterium]